MLGSLWLACEKVSTGRKILALEEMKGYDSDTIEFYFFLKAVHDSAEVISSIASYHVRIKPKCNCIFTLCI